MKKNELKELIREVLREELAPIKEGIAIQIINEQEKLKESKTKTSRRHISSSSNGRMKRMMNESSGNMIQDVLNQTQDEIESGISAPLIRESAGMNFTSADAMNFGAMRNVQQGGMPFNVNPQNVNDIKLQNKIKNAQASGDETTVKAINTVQNNIMNKDYSAILKASIEKSKAKRGV